jgi:hypothetical protein
MTTATKWCASVSSPLAVASAGATDGDPRTWKDAASHRRAAGCSLARRATEGEYQLALAAAAMLAAMRWHDRASAGSVLQCLATHGRHGVYEGRSFSSLSSIPNGTKADASR